MLVIVFWPEQKMEITNKLTSSEYDYFMEEVTVHQYDQLGNQANKMMAKRMEHTDENMTSYLSSPLIVYKNSNQGNWLIYSDKGILIEGKQLELLDRVLIKEESSEGKTITQLDTSNLFINLEKDKAKTQEVVTIKNPSFLTKAVGMEIDFTNEKFFLKSQVESEIYQTKVN